MENYWSFKVTKIINLRKFFIWARLNLPTEVSNSIGECSTLEHKWISKKWITGSTIEYENSFKTRLQKELNEICEYEIDFMPAAKLQLEIERKEWEEKCKLSDEWFETLDDEHKEFVRIYARHFVIRS